MTYLSLIIQNLQSMHVWIPVWITPFQPCYVLETSRSLHVNICWSQLTLATAEADISQVRVFWKRNYQSSVTKVSLFAFQIRRSWTLQKAAVYFWQMKWAFQKFNCWVLISWILKLHYWRKMVPLFATSEIHPVTQFTYHTYILPKYVFTTDQREDKLVIIWNKNFQMKLVCHITY